MQHPPRKIPEKSLVSALQPIRGFVLAQVIYCFLDLGIHDTLVRDGPSTVASLAKTLFLHETRLRGLLQYLANEGFVDLTDGQVVGLTANGNKLGRFRPWYTLLVGGYSQTFKQLPDTLRCGAPYATRDSAKVGAGSCGISQHDALPMTRRLLERIAGRWRTIVDLGCGDGSYLVDLCASIPRVSGFGLDPDEASVKAGLTAASAKDVADRVHFAVGKATAIPDLSQMEKPLCFVTAFVLQEILEQSGRAVVKKLLTSTLHRYPDSYWVVIEVDNRFDDKAIMSTGLGLAYYNPYYLIHHLTEQKLESIDFWKRLYSEAGLRIVAMEHPDPFYDSLSLKVGFLLSRDDSKS